MAVPPSIESEAIGPPVRSKRRVVRWLAIASTGLVGVVVVLLFWPVARISPEIAALIKPGMTAEQAERIVGAPEGWYDGVGGISTNEPVIKGDHWRAWTGARGTLILSPAQDGRVGAVAFYPAIWVKRSVWQILVERLTRSTEEQWRRWWMYGDRA